MEEKTRNLCAQIPESLHARVRREQEALGQTLGQYMTELITKYYEYQANGGKMNMNETIKTLAFQVPESLKERLDRYLAAESRRTGKKLSLKEFMVGLLEKALDEAEAQEQEQEHEQEQDLRETEVQPLEVDETENES